MGINIKNERVEELARRLATQTNQSITGAIEQALSGELRRLEIQSDYATRKARIKEVLRRSGPTPPGATSDHSEFYDELGMFK